ncbi:MAG: transcription termination/antitermination protein NusA [Firmicutes bacterium]|nr:transcription termination/antitermination protein NusA [Bacillota bacterium]MBR6352400.1 transcription termination/antitermination protein NusA [Bacillota bacterium]
MNTDFIEAVEALEREKHMSKDMLIDAIESALVSAYKKNYGTTDQNVRVNIDRETGDIDVFMRRFIVEEVTDPFSEASLEEAQEIDPTYEIGDVIEYQVTPRDFGRIAAQTAKQVVVQRIRETERGMIYDDYISRQTEVVTGVVQRISNDTVFVNMGRAEGILSANEQIPGERYRVNERLKVYVMDVKKTNKGPQIFLSRTHPGLVKRLFELEVPEIQEGTVEIKSYAREAGSRTKIAVCTYDENVDPVGACVGTRGARVQAVVDELNGEKIDIISWSEEPGKLISSALSPAKAEMVLIDESDKSATVVVPDYQLSLAIGKEGQNVRLAAKLCGWKIDIKSHSQFYPAGAPAADEKAETVIEVVESAHPEEDAETADGLPSLRSMKKAELIAFAEEHGIELDPKATNAAMIETISAALG